MLTGAGAEKAGRKAGRTVLNPPVARLIAGNLFNTSGRQADAGAIENFPVQAAGKISSAGRVLCGDVQGGLFQLGFRHFRRGLDAEARHQGDGEPVGPDGGGRCPIEVGTVGDSLAQDGVQETGGLAGTGPSFGGVDGFADDSMCRRSHEPGLGSANPEQGTRWRGRCLQRARQERREPLVDPSQLAQGRARHSTGKAAVRAFKCIEKL